MLQVSAELTVYFEEPFWVGVYVLALGKTLQAAKITFGAEPKDYEIYVYLLSHWRTLNFSPSIPSSLRKTKAKNPKRAIRDAHRQTQCSGVATKAQQALNAAREQNALERAKQRTRRTQEQKERQFLLRQIKKKEKRNGH